MLFDKKNLAVLHHSEDRKIWQTDISREPAAKPPGGDINSLQVSPVRDSGTPTAVPSAAELTSLALPSFYLRSQNDNDNVEMYWVPLGTQLVPAGKLNIRHLLASPVAAKHPLSLSSWIKSQTGLTGILPQAHPHTESTTIYVSTWSNVLVSASFEPSTHVPSSN